MSSDYLELFDPYLYDYDIEITLHVHGYKAHSLVAVLHKVTSCIRYGGVWTIGYEYIGQQATALIPVEAVSHFTAIENRVEVQSTSDESDWELTSGDAYAAESTLTDGISEVEESGVCSECGHSDPHKGGGIGVCDAEDCGCDGPRIVPLGWAD